MTKSDEQADILVPGVRFHVLPEAVRLRRVRERVREYIAPHFDDEDDVDEVVLCVEEACTNAIRHGGGDQGFDVAMAIDAVWLTIEVIDSGEGFDAARLDADVAAPDAMSVGGRGLFLIARLMDEASVSVDGSTRVHMRRRLGGARGRASGAPLSRTTAADLSPVGGSASAVLASVEGLADGFLGVDWEWNVVYANPRARKLLGGGELDLRGSDLWRLFGELVGTDAERELRRTMDRGDPSRFEHTFAEYAARLEVRVSPSSTGLSVWLTEARDRDVPEASSDDARRAHDTAILHAVADLSLRSLDEADLAAAFLKLAESRLGIVGSSVRVLDAARTWLVPIASTGLTGESRTRAVPLAESYLVAEVVTSGEPIVVPDTRSATIPPGTQALLDNVGPGDKAFVMLPLVARSLADGVLTLVWPQPQAWSVDDTVFLSTLSHELAVGLSEARSRRGLAKTTQKLAFALRSAAAGTWDWDVVSGHVEWSPELFHLFGKDPEVDVASFDSWNAILHPDDLDDTTAKLNEALEHGTLLDSEYRIVRPDGEVRWVNALGHGVYDDAGRPTRMSGIVIDITRRRSAEEERLRTEEQMHFALDRLRAGAWELDLVDHTARRSLEHDRVFGYTSLLSEWTYELFLEHVLPEDRARVADAFTNAIETGGTWDFECRILRLDGAVRWIWASGQHLSGHGPHATLTGIVQDITERKVIEEERDAERRRLRAVLDALPVALGISDVDGRVLQLNQMVEKLWAGPSPRAETVDEYDRYKAWWPDSGERVLPHEWTTARVLASGHEILDDVFDIERFDGSRATILSSATPIVDADGGLVGTVGITQDITERETARRLGEALNHIAESVASVLDVDEILTRSVSSAAEALGADSSSICFLEEGGWVPRFVWKTPADVVGVPIPVASVPYADVAVRSSSVVAVDDCRNDPRVNRELQDSWHVGAVMVAPLIWRGAALAGLFVNFHDRPHAFTTQETDFLGQVAVFVSGALENARLYRAERHVAETLQEALLRLPEHVSGVRFAHKYQSASDAARVGGDFYDLFELDNDLLGLTIGDVSGKGLKAATLTGLVKHTIRAHAVEKAKTPADVMGIANTVLLRGSDAGVFATAFFGILDCRDGRLTYCNAGHPAPVLVRSGGGAALLPSTSPLIGAFADFSFQNAVTQVDVDDLLLFYTDGLTEARRGDELFGEDGLLALLAFLPPATPDVVLRTTVEAAVNFAGGQLSDDLAILAVQRQELDRPFQQLLPLD